MDRVGIFFGLHILTGFSYKAFIGQEGTIFPTFHVNTRRILLGEVVLSRLVLSVSLKKTSSQLCKLTNRN